MDLLSDILMVFGHSSFLRVIFEQCSGIILLMFTFYCDYSGKTLNNDFNLFVKCLILNIII
jgi:hypothetical protein